MAEASTPSVSLLPVTTSAAASGDDASRTTAFTLSGIRIVFTQAPRADQVDRPPRAPRTAGKQDLGVRAVAPARGPSAAET